MGIQQQEDVTFVVNLANSFASVAPATSATQTMAAPNLRTTDLIEPLGKQTFQAGLAVAAARCLANGVLTVEFLNCTAGAIVPTANDRYAFKVFRPERTYTAVPF